MFNSVRYTSYAAEIAQSHEQGVAGAQMLIDGFRDAFERLFL